MSGTGTPPEVTVDDTRGIAVFRATMSGGDVNGSRVTRSQEGMRLVLSSVQGDAILAYSRVVKLDGASQRPWLRFIITPMLSSGSCVKMPVASTL